MNEVGKKVLRYLSLLLAFTANYSTAADLVILRGNEDYPPDEMHIEGELSGFHIELIKNTAKSIGLSIVFESVPWKRAIKMLKNGEGDALSYATKSIEREKYALFLQDNIISESQYHFVIKSNRQEEISYNGNIEDLTHYTIGIQRGYVYGEEFEKTKFMNKRIFNSVKQMTSLISSNRIDIGILTIEEYNAQKSSKNFKDITILSPAFISHASYLAFSKVKNANKTAELFAEAMRIYKDSKGYAALKHKYAK